jgi:serine/threonine protein kinase
MNVESLFAAARALPPEERATYLNTACAGQPELRAAVEKLLAADETSAGASSSPATVSLGATGNTTTQPQDTPHARPSESGTTAYRRAAQANSVIAGRYVLQEKIGEGGMGEVWVAKQTEPVKRTVAVKLVKAGMDSRAVLQRFEAERQALALMDHPNIARVFDGGMTADQRPFFVMELVNGLSLTKFCDDAKLDIRGRLELFAAVCQAVQHAHQKGIIHRDLKPSNILVSRIDGRPVPKVIDFGVAKALGGSLLDESEATQFGVVVGTLEYMAPEQASRAGDDVDTRADIYSLGVILYELLTGLRPLDAQRLRRAAYTEMIRVIQEEEPTKPSTRLSTDDSLPSRAAVRQTEPRRLVALLRGELDWVVMKCLEKRRDLRYETASGLARDLERYLASEPVEARPPSAGYRLRKFVVRHKAAAVAAAVLLLALMSIAAVSSTAAVLIWREQKKTEAQRKKAAENAEAAINVVRDLSTYVESYEMGSGNTATSEAQRKDQVDTALSSYERLLALHPQDATLRWQVARMYRIRGNLSRFLDKTAEAEKSYEESIRLFNQLVAEHPTEPRFRELSALTMRDYGGLLQRLGRFHEAIKTADDAIRLYEDLRIARPNQLNYTRNLAGSLLSRSDWVYQVGRFAESERDARKSAELYATLAETPGTRPEPVDPLFRAMAEHNLAMALRELNKIDDALKAHNNAVERITGLTKVTNSRDAWSFYHRTRAERAWTLSRRPDRAAEAIADLESAIAGWDKLIKQMGENPTDLHRKSVASLYSARLKLLGGQPDAAAKDLAVAALVLEGLVVKQPAIPMYRYDLGRALTTQGQVAASPEQAAIRYQKAREMLDAAVKQYPENALYKQALKELDTAAVAKP